MIQFNGNVQIKGNVEMYDNGSMKITSSPLEVHITHLESFIEKTFEFSHNKQAYLNAAKDLKNSSDPSILKRAVQVLKTMGAEVGKNILITGLSTPIVELIKTATGQ